MWVVAVAVVAALLVGAAIGYVAGLPQRNDLRDDKRAAEAALESTRNELASVKEVLDETKEKLETADVGARAAKVCRDAADDADALLTAWQNVSTDIDAWWQSEPGSSEEQELGDKIDAQFADMEAKHTALQEELANCRFAMREA